MAFPAEPLDVRVKLRVGSQWVDITNDVRVESGLTIRRGVSDESYRSDPARCSLTLDNRNGKYSPRNPLSPYYGLLGRNTPVKIGVRTGDTYLLLPGMQSLAVTTPHTSNLNVGTSTLDIRCLVALDRWDSSRAHTFVGKSWSAYSFGLNEQNRLRLEVTAGGSFLTVPSTEPVVAANGAALWVRGVHSISGSNRTFTYYTSQDGTTWTQLGQPIVYSGNAGIDSNTNPLVIGDRGDGVSPMAGKVYRVMIYSGANLIVDVDFRNRQDGASSITDATGRVWTIAEPAELTDLDYRFCGEISEWPQRWDVSGRDVTVPVEASGILRRLGQGANTIRSTMYRGLTARLYSGDVVAYWPCEDPEGSTVLSSAVGAAPMRIKGSPELASFDGFLCSEPIPILNDSEWTGSVPMYANTGQTQLRFLLAVPSDGEPTDQTIIRFNTTGTANRWELNLDNAGGLALLAYSGDTVIHNSGYIAFRINGKRMRVSIELTQNGSNINYQIATLTVWDTTIFGYTGTVTGRTVGTVTRVIVNPGGGLKETAIGHISLQNRVTLMRDMYQELFAYVGETASERIARLCREEGIPVQITDHPIDSTFLGPQLPSTLLELLTEAADADMGILTEARNFHGLIYRPRRSMYNKPSAVVLDYAAGHVAPPFEPVDDDQFTRNDVTVSKAGGSSARAVKESGPLSVLDPPQGVGRYSEDTSVNVYSELHLPDQAGWRLHMGTVNEARFPLITVNLAASGVRNDPELTRRVRQLDVGDRITVVNLPPWFPPDPVEQVARGFEETIGPFEWSITANCTPWSPYRVAVYGQSRYATAGSQLTNAITASATSISVTTTKGPRWTTDPAHFPFDVMVGGERMTVVSITGTGSTQSFTVVRGVNGITKPHPAGTEVQLAEVAVRAL